MINGGKVVKIPIIIALDGKQVARVIRTVKVEHSHPCCYVD
jgi:hypothetical protein